MFTKAQIVELYRQAATELPRDIIDRLQVALDAETDATPKEILKTLLANVTLAQQESRPMCQDTGTSLFYVERPASWSEAAIRKIIEDATTDATQTIPLRPNAVDPVTGKSLGNVPLIYFAEATQPRIKLLLKGGGSENISTVYQLPDEALDAERTLDGVRRCVLDAVVKAQGKGCPPYIIGVGLAGTLEEAAHLAKQQLLRPLNESSVDFVAFEEQLVTELNSLGIGPMGLGGRTVALAVKVAAAPRHPATFFVGISFGCWATRRATL